MNLRRRSLWITFISMLYGCNQFNRVRINSTQVGNFVIELGYTTRLTDNTSSLSGYCICVGQKSASQTTICDNGLTRIFDSREDAENYKDELIEMYTLLEM